MVRVELESDGMLVKVMAASGALPATIDAWVLTRGRTAGSGRLLVLSSSDLRMSFEMCR